MPDEDDNGGTEPIVQYPNSTELMGRGIELVQSQGPHVFPTHTCFEVEGRDVLFKLSTTSVKCAEFPVQEFSS